MLFIVVRSALKHVMVQLQVPRGPAEAVAFFVRQSGPLSRTADMPESSAGNTGKSSCLCGGHLGGLVCSAWKLSSR